MSGVGVRELYGQQVCQAEVRIAATQDDADIRAMRLLADYLEALGDDAQFQGLAMYWDSGEDEYVYRLTFTNPAGFGLQDTSDV